MMSWAIWCAMVVAGCACAEAAPASNALTPAIDWAQFDSTAPDDESIGYAVPSMSGRLTAGAPWLYLLAEVPRDSQENERVKRRMPQLSIDMPMSVLRNKLNLEMERKVHALRAAVNRNFLNDIGKRGFGLRSSEVDKY
ncbi:diuretic hormone 1 isoform X2 [Vanessa atalanta]|uniref:diuretic hormone 1 isoform X2 n=1 Tax=Vanessa atalanta TaxID=42275 RepID=UPI000E77E187|nr:diuretic hormone 1 isoform X2 [Vanessa tameamea]XP_047538848.1 diuretic hormone 1 isoform X2 [Vanessa atalanta]